MSEKLIGYTVSNKAIAGVVGKFKDKEVGSLMIASDTMAKSLSGDYLGDEFKNGKMVIHNDGINLGYWSAVLGGRIADGLVAIRKRSDSQYDMGCFRPGQHALSGVIYKDDPALLSSSSDNTWRFVQSVHANPQGTRYQVLSSVQLNDAGVERDKVYTNSEQNTAELMYFSGELSKNAKYCDSMIRAGKIDWRV